MVSLESPETVFPTPATNPPKTLHRSLSLWNSLTIGFATVSPVAGLYAIIGVQTVVTGGGWFTALALCLVMQLLVATVYAGLSSQIPIAGGAYKWARQLGGATTGTYAGAIYVSSNFDDAVCPCWQERAISPARNDRTTLRIHVKNYGRQCAKVSCRKSRFTHLRRKPQL